MKKINNLLLLLFALFLSINLSYGAITFNKISLINNSVFDYSNLVIEISLYNTTSSGGVTNQTNIVSINNPVLSKDSYANILISADDISAKQYCKDKYNGDLISYTFSVKGNLYLLYDNYEWKRLNSWSINKIDNINCQIKSNISSSYDINLYYNLDNTGNQLISTNKLYNKLKLNNLALGAHNITFYATNTISNITSQIYYFNITSPSIDCILDNGQKLENGKNITMYENFIVKSYQNCKSEIRVCNNGILSGNYNYFECRKEEPFKLVFHEVNLVNLTKFYSNSMQINITLVNENKYVEINPGRDVSGFNQLPIYADNLSINRLCFEKFGQNIYYKYDTFNDVYAYSKWNGTNWIYENPHKINSLITKVYCQGSTNDANLYYSLDGGPYIHYPTQNKTYIDFKITNLSYNLHSIRFKGVANESFTLSSVYYFINSNPNEDPNRFPKTFDENLDINSTPKSNDKNFAQKIFSWVSGIFK